MLALNRQAERRPDIVSWLKSKYTTCLDLSAWEQHNVFLEGTGSCVVDRPGKRAYLVRSSRSHEDLAHTLCRALGVQLVAFDAVDANGVPVYHTNVVMTVGRTFAMVCFDSIRDPEQRKLVYNSLAETHFVISLSMDQMNSFCANALEVKSLDGTKHSLVMSSEAHAGLTEEQRSQLVPAHVTQIVHTPLPTLQTIGGGGARCCIAEIFD
eukprot:c7543_g1_i2.p1 GENE.c7543_g1_i2~~c7543_g1_i2.p1  ORF type:complete len:210 (-),score=58.90 c7543_g1_i2:346-975(-)